MILLCASTVAKAQFYSSERVYVYKYEYTDNDGIKSKSKSGTYYWVNFQNDMMGVTWANSLSFIRQKLLENPEYYQDAARNNLATNYNCYKSSPAGLPSRGPAQATVTLIKYCSEYSTGSKTTYRSATARCCHTGNIWDTYGANNYWSKLNWDSQCYSFSSDKSEMIIWKTSDSGNRDYYKRIEESELKPNTDFLY